MLKKLLVISLMLVGMTFASNPYGYGSIDDANAAASVIGSSSETQSVATQTQYDDLKFALALHPMMILIGAAQGMPYFYLTFEAGFGSFFSLITRPAYFSGTFRGTSQSGWSINEGFRFYISGRGHKGWYVEPQILYLSNDAFGGFSMIGAEILSGYKVVSGRFVFGVDAGFRYAESNADEVNIMGEGFTVDLNMYIGFAF